HVVIFKGDASFINAGASVSRQRLNGLTSQQVNESTNPRPVSLAALEQRPLSLKYRSALLIILAILIIDQVLKIYIKTTFYPGLAGQVNMIGDWAKLHFLENE